MLASGLWLTIPSSQLPGASDKGPVTSIEHEWTVTDINY